MDKILLEVFRVEESHPNMLGRVASRSVPGEGVDVNQEALNVYHVLKCFLNEMCSVNKCTENKEVPN